MAQDIILWKTKINNFDCYVQRLSKDTATLKIKSNENIVFSKSVELSFNAIPNPEIDDILLWQEICEKEIRKI